MFYRFALSQSATPTSKFLALHREAVGEPSCIPRIVRICLTVKHIIRDGR